MTANGNIKWDTYCKTWHIEGFPLGRYSAFGGIKYIIFRYVSGEPMCDNRSTGGCWKFHPDQCMHYLNWTFLFRSQEAVALGILNSGSSIGGVFFPILFNFLVSQFGLKGTFLVAGAISLNTLPAAVICAFDRSNVGNKGKSSSDSAKAEANIGDSTLPVSADNGCCECNFLKWLNGTVLLVINGTAVSFGAIMSFMGFVLDVFISKGSSREAGVPCLSVINFMAVATRLFLALTKRFCDNSWAIPQLVSYCTLATFGTLLITLFNSPEVMLVGAGLIGIAFGGLLVTGTAFVMDNVPRVHIPVAIGIWQTWLGINMVTAGPFFGAIYDWTSSYQSVLIVIVCLHIISCFSFLAAMFVRHNGQKDKKKEPRQVEATYNKIKTTTCTCV